MGVTRLAAAMSLGKKKAVLDISKSFCCQKNRAGCAFFTSGGTNYRSTDTGRRLEKDPAEEDSGVTGFVKDTTKRAAETVVGMGDTAKKIADDVWGNTKDTTHKIKETVAGEDRDEVAPTSSTPTGTSVDDVRKPSGGSGS